MQVPPAAEPHEPSPLTGREELGRAEELARVELPLAGAEAEAAEPEAELEAETELPHVPKRD